MPALTGQFARATFFVLLAILLFDVQGLIIKLLGDRYPVQQLASFRNLFGLIPSLAVLYLSSEWRASGYQFRLKRWRLGLTRGLFIALAQYCFYLSITRMEFAIASTLTYISPVFITLLSIPLLKHKVGGWRWVAVITGFIGVIFIMRPGTELFNLNSLLPIGAALGYSISTVLVQRFDKQTPTALINLYASFGSLVGALILVLLTSAELSVDSLNDWLWLIGMGLVGGFAVLSLITAYRLARPASLSPFEYFGIPFAFVLGWIFFDESPFGQLLPGVIFIILGGLVIAWRENSKSFARAKPGIKL
ncbi:MAG: drug/metabolite transporter (DMT)-like permease [Planctomycetota bacterium]|jgi:drug/metabolite transporter (DMT)-like permease